MSKIVMFKDNGRKHRNAVKPDKIFLSLVFFMLLGNVISNCVMYQAYEQSKHHADVVTSRLKLASEDKIKLDTKVSALEEKNKHLEQVYKEVNYEKEKALAQNKQIAKINRQLSDMNKEINADNSAFHNSLKAVAAIGIKPKHYSTFRGFNMSRNMLSKREYLGKFLGTAYTPSKDECGNNHGITNSGIPIIPGVTVAIDKRYWPFGTLFYIKGIGYAVAMDTGGLIKGRNRFDIAVFDKKFAKKLGKGYWDVYLVKYGNGRVQDTIAIRK